MGRSVLAILLVLLCGCGSEPAQQADSPEQPAAHDTATAAPSTGGPTPTDTGESDNPIEQIIAAAQDVMPGPVASVSFGLRDDKTLVYFPDPPRNALGFVLEDGALVEQGTSEYPEHEAPFSLEDLGLLAPRFDAIKEDVARFAQENSLGVDKRIFLTGSFTSVPGSTFSTDEPVVHFELGDPGQALSTGNYPCLYRVYSMRTGDLLWQAGPDDTAVVFQFFTG